MKLIKWLWAIFLGAAALLLGINALQRRRDRTEAAIIEAQRQKVMAKLEALKAENVKDRERHRIAMQNAETAEALGHVKMEKLNETIESRQRRIDELRRSLGLPV